MKPRGKNVRPTSTEIAEAWSLIKDAARGGDVAAASIIVRYADNQRDADLEAMLERITEAFNRSAEKMIEPFDQFASVAARARAAHEGLSQSLAAFADEVTGTRRALNQLNRKET